MQPDVAGIGKPSDHNVPFAQKYLDRRTPKNKSFIIKCVRPFPDSGISEFGSWILKEDFSPVSQAGTSTEKVAVFENLISAKIENIFPKKEIKIYNGDKEWMDADLRKLRRQKSREYVRNKKSMKFLELQQEFLKKKKENSQSYIQNQIEA